MTPERWQQVKDAFHAALEVEEKERHAFLVREAGGDAELMAEVEELLKRHVPGEGDGDTADPTETTAPRAVTKTPTTVYGEGPGDQVSHYRLLQRIGEGGMGAVYMAEQEEPVRRRVALKIIKPGMDSAQVIARFEAERQALAMMDHPNIARVLDAGTTGAGRPYFVMELVQGEPITQYCDRHHLTPRARLELFVQVCRAVQHAHQKGIIHRDLKPSNVLVATCDGKPLPKVIDFGVAKALHQRLTDKTMFTQFGAVVGTPEYMSPEQTENDLLGPDTRSDIYTLGVVLYELLTGSTPLDSKRLREEGYQKMMQTIREQEPPPPSTRLHRAGADLAKISARRGLGPRRLTRLLTGDLDWIVMKALEKEPSRRYESADALSRDIERYMNNEPVEASPPSTFYRLGKAARRHPAAVRRCAAAALVVVCGIAYFAYSATQALQHEREALHQRQIAEAYDQAKRDVMDRKLDEADLKVKTLENLQASEGEDEIIRGAIAVEQERPDAALEPLLKAEKFHTQPVLVGALLSWAYLNYGQVNESQAQLAKLAGCNPKLPEEFLLNGWVTVPIDPVQAEIDLTVAMRLYNTSLARLMRANAGVEASLDRNDDERMLQDAILDLNRAEDELGSSKAAEFLKARTGMLVLQRAASIYGDLASKGGPQAERYGNSSTELEGKARKRFNGLSSTSRATTQCVEYLVRTEKFDELLEYGSGTARPEYWKTNRAAYWKIYASYRLKEWPHANDLAKAECLKDKGGAERLGDMAFAMMETEEDRKAAVEAADAWSKALQVPGSETLEQPMLLSANEVRMMAGKVTESEKVADGIVHAGISWRYRDGWYEHLANYQAGDLRDAANLQDDDLLKDAKRSQMSQCEAYFNIGLRHLNKKDRTGALDDFEKAAQTHETSLIEWRWASAFAERMKADTDWPAWLLKPNK